YNVGSRLAYCFLVVRIIQRYLEVRSPGPAGGAGLCLPAAERGFSSFASRRDRPPTRPTTATAGKRGGSMSDRDDHRVVYVSHPASGLARSNFPMTCHVSGSEIVRTLPFHVPDDVRLYEIRTSTRGSFTRPRKEVQMPLAIAAKRRVHTSTRVKY